jgi:hypothetical protein
VSTPGDTCVSIDIAEEAALEVAETQHPDLLSQARVDQYLVHVDGNPGAIQPGRYWLVELSEFSIEGDGAPMTADGTPAESPPLTHGHLFVDAERGELAIAHWTE